MINTKNKYLDILLHPEENKGVKIPSNVPVPSCSFQLHNSIELPKTNTYGNMAIIFNPFFLASNDNEFVNNDAFNRYVGLRDTQTKSNYYSSLYINRDDSLTGDNDNTNFGCFNIGQTIEPIYDQYRLVSASIIIKYTGKLEEVSGVIGGGIIYEKDNRSVYEVSVKGVDSSGRPMAMDLNPTITTMKKYGNFNLARNSYYNKEYKSNEGIRMLYFPIDNSYEEYTKLLNDSIVNMVINQEDISQVFNECIIQTSEYVKNGFKFMIYIQGAPAQKKCFRCDIYCNFECLPNASYLNYLPITMNNEFVTKEEKKEAF